MKKKDIAQLTESIGSKLQRLIELEKQAVRHRVEVKPDLQLRTYDPKTRQAYDPKDSYIEDLMPMDRLRLLEEMAGEFGQLRDYLGDLEYGTEKAIRILARILRKQTPSALLDLTEIYALDKLSDPDRLEAIANDAALDEIAGGMDHWN